MTKPFIPKNKQGFLLAVYGILISQLLLTFAIVYGMRNFPGISQITRTYFWAYAIASLVLVLILTFVPMPIWVKFGVFTLLSAVLGGLLHQASAFLPAALVNQALAGTLAIFVSMSVLALILANAGIDLSWMGAFLLAALIGLIIAQLVSMFLSPEKTSAFHKALLFIGLILFSIYIIYETNIIVQPGYTEDSVEAALGLYLDFVNIFSRILALEDN